MTTKIRPEVGQQVRIDDESIVGGVGTITMIFVIKTRLYVEVAENPSKLFNWSNLPGNRPSRSIEKTFD